MTQVHQFQSLVADSLTATIAAADSLSDDLRLGGCNVVGLVVPASFTGTSLSFLAKNSESGNYAPMYNPQGARLAVDITPTELVTNGAFAADTDWTKGTGWTIGSGTASSDGTQTGDSDLEQGIAVTEGVRYQISFTISGYSAGNLTPRIGGTSGAARAADGTFTEIITAGAGGSPQLELRADEDFVGSVDNVTVVEADRWYAIAPVDLASARFLKLVSNASEAAEREIEVITRSL